MIVANTRGGRSVLKRSISRRPHATPRAYFFSWFAIFGLKLQKNTKDLQPPTLTVQGLEPDSTLPPPVIFLTVFA